MGLIRTTPVETRRGYPSYGDVGQVSCTGKSNQLRGSRLSFRPPHDGSLLMSPAVRGGAKSEIARQRNRTAFSRIMSPAKIPTSHAHNAGYRPPAPAGEHHSLLSPGGKIKQFIKYSFAPKRQHAPSSSCSAVRRPTAVAIKSSQTLSIISIASSMAVILFPRRQDQKTRRQPPLLLKPSRLPPLPWWANSQCQ